MYLEVVFQELISIEELGEEVCYMPNFEEFIDNEDFEFDEEALELTLPEKL